MSFQNECSFVSLRDVERAMKVIMWFYTNSELIDEVIGEEGHDTNEDSCGESSKNENEDSDDELEQAKPVRTFENSNNLYNNTKQPVLNSFTKYSRLLFFLRKIF